METLCSTWNVETGSVPANGYIGPLAWKYRLVSLTESSKQTIDSRLKLHTFQVTPMSISEASCIAAGMIILFNQQINAEVVIVSNLLP